MAEISGKLHLPAIHMKQEDGYLIATTYRLLYYFEVTNEPRFDEFSYGNIQSITLKKHAKKGMSLLFESDNELQIVQTKEDAQLFFELVHHKIT